MKEWLQRPRALVVLLLATLLVVLGGASFAHRITAVEPLVGVEWTRSSDGAVALEVAPGSPAARAGLEAGDILLEIEGRDVAHFLEAKELGWHAGEAGSLALTIRRGATERVLPAMIAGHASSNFATALMLKDVSLATTLGINCGAPMYLHNVVRGLLQQGVYECGSGSNLDDMNAVIAAMAGVSLDD